MINTSDILIIHLFLIVLYGLYYGLFQKLRFFGLNRIYLLLAPVAAIFLGLWSWPVISPEMVGIELNALTFDGLSQVGRQSSGVNLVLAIYALGMAVSFLVLLTKIFSLFRIMYSVDFQEQDNYHLGFTERNILSFSFLKWIVLNHRDKDRKETVIDHELEHIRQFHTFDNLLFEIYKVVFWCNPAIWNMHKQLRSVHEFSVDEKVFLNMDANRIAEILIGPDSEFQELGLTNSFGSKSNILNRIQMMHSKQTQLKKKLRYLLILPVILGFILLKSCSEEAMTVNDPEQNIPDTDSEIVSRIEDLTKKPEFPGGMSAFKDYLISELKYPEEAKEDGISGPVYMSFVVDYEGNVINPEVKKGIHPLLDVEAIRVISSMPKWEPGEKSGKPVSVQYTLPIQFTLD